MRSRRNRATLLVWFVTPAMSKRFPLHPPHPERNCWGCDRYCKASDMLCGNGSNRTQHPLETLGPDWAEVLGMSGPSGSDAQAPSAQPTPRYALPGEPPPA